MDDSGSGLVISHQANTVRVDTGRGPALLCAVPRKLQRPVCGDQVDWRLTGDRSGSITRIHPRRNWLARPDPRGGERPLAANLDRLLLVLATRPEFQEPLIDRYLVAAAHFNLPVVLLLNKVDLLDRDALAAARQRLRVYSDIGYALWLSSVEQADGLDALQELLRAGRSMLVGQSGVGKSSLIHRLLPGGAPDLEIGAISAATGLGRHTTSASTLYRLPGGGELVDSPGVRDFGLWHLPDAAIAPGFIEFRSYLDRCRFRNCRHDGEPGCAVQEAVESGAIRAKRLDSYRHILHGNHGH